MNDRKNKKQLKKESYCNWFESYYVKIEEEDKIKSILSEYINEINISSIIINYRKDIILSEIDWEKQTEIFSPCFSESFIDKYEFYIDWKSFSWIGYGHSKYTILKYFDKIRDCTLKYVISLSDLQKLSEKQQIRFLNNYN